MQIPVRNQNGDTVETIELDDAVFNVPMNHPLVHQSLVIYQLNKRQGTHGYQDQGSSVGRRAQTLAPKTHRACPPGEYSLTSVAARRRCLRTTSAELPQESASPDAPPGTQMRSLR